MKLSKNFEINEHYDVQFLPNIYGIENIMILNYKFSDSNILRTNHYTYILRDALVIPVSIPINIIKMIQYCNSGYIGTPEGHFICEINDYNEIGKNPNRFDFNVNLLHYFANNDKTIITLNNHERKNNSLLTFNDSVVYSERNPFKMKNLKLSFDVVPVILNYRTYKSYKNLRWNETENILNEEEILNKFKNVPSLINVIEAEKEYLLRILDNKILFV